MQVMCQRTLEKINRIRSSTYSSRHTARFQAPVLFLMERDLHSVTVTKTTRPLYGTGGDRTRSGWPSLRKTACYKVYANKKPSSAAGSRLGWLANILVNLTKMPTFGAWVGRVRSPNLLPVPATFIALKQVVEPGITRGHPFRPAV